jgi:amino acid permease
MTFWLYDPKKLTSSSSIIPSRQKDIGDILNFLTFICVFVYVYLHKNNNIEKYKNIIIFSFGLISLLGVFSNRFIKDNDNNNTLIDWGDYSSSLSID